MIPGLDIVLGLLLTPPGLYVTLALIGVGIFLFLLNKFKEPIIAAIIVVLDCVYPIWQFTVDAIRATWAAFKRCVYPMKETFVYHGDAVDQHLNPWKQKKPYTHLPTFRVGASEQPHVPSFSY
eukprot:TRINITY_DN111755_c0_g1_i1.p2 TRINITY_DN111755_c0_g1~~TRINITY_DN111755_c0_g1_i1.p2  ORF type:complete len:123 (-),score=19.92 TRINITY_DN111755_c0_g1_i1:107-475(-)